MVAMMVGIHEYFGSWERDAGSAVGSLGMAGFALCATTPMLPDVTPPLTPKSSSACDNVYTAAAPCLLLRAPLVSPSVRFFRKYSGTYVPRHEKAEHRGTMLLSIKLNDMLI